MPNRKQKKGQVDRKPRPGPRKGSPDDSLEKTPEEASGNVPNDVSSLSGSNSEKDSSTTQQQETSSNQAENHQISSSSTSSTGQNSQQQHATFAGSAPLHQYVPPSVPVPMNGAPPFFGYPGANYDMYAGMSGVPAPAPGGNGMKRPAPYAANGFYTKMPRMDPNAINPSIISSSKTVSSEDFPPEPVQKSDADLAKLTPAERRRYERNLREQQRSHRISQQIKQLRDVLVESSVPFKQNKFSILVSVVEYIKQLQSRAIMLDNEQKRLSKALNDTTEMINSGQLPSGSSGDESDNSSDSRSENDLAFIRGLDYQRIFDCSPFAVGISSLDGRILSCNNAFKNILDEHKSEGNILTQSIFVYIKNHEDVFEAMADLLKRSSAASETGEATINDSVLLYWTGKVETSLNRKLSLSITLANTSRGSPKYFSLSAVDCEQ